MDVQSLEDWKGRVEQLLNSSDERNPGDLIRDLCDIAAAMGDDTAEAVLEAYPELFDHAPGLMHANFQRIIRQDVVETQRILSLKLDKPTPFPEVASPKRLISYNRSRDMFERIEFSDFRRVVMVGCGSLPFTTFHVEDQTAVPVIVGLDIIPEAVETAKEVAAWLGYERVSFELCDGREYDYGDAQMVYLGSTVSPKPGIVSRIADTAPDDVRIVVRDPYSLARLWVESSEVDLDPRLEVEDRDVGVWSLTRDVYLRRKHA